MLSVPLKPKFVSHFVQMAFPVLSVETCVQLAIVIAADGVHVPAVLNV